MQITADKLAAVMTIVGSVLFLVAAFLPISRIFIEPSPERTLEIINASPTAWTSAQVMFGLGALMTVAGLAIAAFQLRGLPTASVGYLSIALLLFGGFAWIWHIYARLDDPAMFAQGLVAVHDGPPCVARSSNKTKGPGELPRWPTGQAS